MISPEIFAKLIEAISPRFNELLEQLARGESRCSVMKVNGFELSTGEKFPFQVILANEEIGEVLSKVILEYAAAHDDTVEGHYSTYDPNRKVQ